MTDRGGGKSPGRMPHIAYIQLWYPAFSQSFIFREVEGLRRAGMRVSVYSLYGLYLRHASGEMRAAAAHTHALGCRALPVVLRDFFRALARDPGKTWNLFRTLVLRPRPPVEAGETLWGFLAGFHLARLFAETGVEGIHAPWPRGQATAAFVASKLSGIPFSMTLRGDDLGPTEPDLPEKTAACLFIRTNNRADAKRIRALLPPERAKDAFLVHNSLTLAPECRRQGPRSPLRIVAVGRFCSFKGFEFLLRACAILKRRGFPFHLTLAGASGPPMGGYLTPRLQRLRRRLDLADCVDMPGRLSRAGVSELLRSGDVLVAPSIIDARGRRDGIPNALIEAMSVELPVIASEVHAIPEIVVQGVTGTLTPPEDPRAIADALMRLAARPEEAGRMARAGRLLVVERFSEERNVRRLLRLYVDRHGAAATGVSGGRRASQGSDLPAGPL